MIISRCPSNLSLILKPDISVSCEVLPHRKWHICLSQGTIVYDMTYLSLAGYYCLWYSISVCQEVLSRMTWHICLSRVAHGKCLHSHFHLYMLAQALLLPSDVEELKSGQKTLKNCHLTSTQKITSRK